ncbi:hypothetical protein ACFX12_039273 [Malus domestica]
MKKRRAWTLMEKPILLTEYGAAMEVGSDNETTSPALLDDEINPLDATELPESLARKIIGVDSDSGYEIMRVMKIHLKTKTQAVPVIMSSRDCNGIAKTGSGVCLYMEALECRLEERGAGWKRSLIRHYHFLVTLCNADIKIYK